MRIIAGEYRSRRLLSPPDDSPTRPIPDRVKESLFAMLRGHVEGAEVFDGFAGSGSFGLEALSRGAARCVFVERDRVVAALLKQNIELLEAGDRADVVVGDALGPGALARCPRPCPIIFLDPPYALIDDAAGWGRVRTQVQRLLECLSDDGFLLLRTPWPFTHAMEDGVPAAAGGHEPDTDDAESEPVKIPRSPVDLGISGAVGPETHEYGSTAVHLYQRRGREGAV